MGDMNQSLQKKLVDYQCKRANLSGFSTEIIEDLQLKFPQSYQNPAIMAMTAQKVMEMGKSPVCVLPFCHTVEAEAFGGLINLNDGIYGPRAAGYAYDSLEALSELPDMDFSQGRLCAVLEACKILKADGEMVALEISGLFTILSNLINLSQVFKAWRKNSEAVERILQHITGNLYRYMAEAKSAGVDLICYADPAGSLSIVGPKYVQQGTELVVYPLLKKAAVLIDDTCILHLCPKTTLVLLGLGLAERQDIQLTPGIGYAQACLKVIGQGKIIGQTCVKNADCILWHGKVWTLNLK